MPGSGTTHDAPSTHKLGLSPRVSLYQIDHSRADDELSAARPMIVSDPDLCADLLTVATDDNGHTGKTIPLACRRRT